MIERVDFVGLVVQAKADGRNIRSHQNYYRDKWTGWTVEAKQGLVMFTGPAGESVEVPRGHCVIYRRAEPAKEE